MHGIDRLWGLAVGGLKLLEGALHQSDDLVNLSYLGQEPLLFLLDHSQLVLRITIRRHRLARIIKTGNLSFIISLMRLRHGYGRKAVDFVLKVVKFGLS